MQYIDDLVVLLSSDAPPDEKDLGLRQILDLVVTPAARPITDWLEQEEQNSTSPLSGHAASVLGHILPNVLAGEYGFDEQTGAFSHEMQGKGADLPSVGGVSGSFGRKLRREVWHSVGSFALQGCIPPLVRAASSASGRQHVLAVRCLSRYLHYRAREGLKELSDSSPRAVMALAAVGDPDAITLVLSTLRQSGDTNPDLVRVLGQVPTKLTAARLRKCISSPDARLRTSAGIALEGFGEYDPIELARPLFSMGGPIWPMVHAARSLGKACAPDAVTDLFSLYEGSNQATVQAALIEAIGRLGGVAATSCLISALKHGDEPVKAAALDGLAQQGGDLRPFSTDIFACQDSNDPHLALRAAILGSDLDRERSVAKCAQWLHAPQESFRLASTQLLGHLRPANLVTVAKALAVSDPSVRVRSNLLNSLMRFPTQLAENALMMCRDRSMPALKPQALRCWARAAGVGQSAVIEHLVASYETDENSSVRLEALSLLGTAGGPTVLETFEGALASADPLTATAAAKAISVAGADDLGEDLYRATRKAAPALLQPIVVALWSLGDNRMTALLERLLSGDEANFAAGARALHEILLLSRRLPGSPRHTRLAGWFATLRQSEDYEAFCQARLGIQGSSDGPAGPSSRPGTAGGTTTPMGTGQREVQALHADALSGSMSMGSGTRRRPSRLVRRVSAVQESPNRRRGLALGFLLCLGVGVGAAFLWPAGDRAGSITPRGLVVTALSGDARGGPPGPGCRPLTLNQALSLPCMLTTGKGGRLAASIDAVPGDRFVLGEDSNLTVSTLEPRQKPEGFTCKAGRLTGSCRLELPVGNPQVMLDLQGTAFTCEQAVVDVSIVGGRANVTVRRGEVELQGAEGTLVVKTGQQCTWDCGRSPSAVRSPSSDSH